MLGFPLLYFKGMRLLMFQLSGFYIMFRAAVPAVHGLGGARMALLGLTVSRRLYIGVLIIIE